jgi:hypothetical protein
MINIDKFKEILSEMKIDLLDELLVFINDLKDRINLISAKEHALNERLIEIERERRRKNLIIKGFRESKKSSNNLEESLLEFINSKLQVKVDKRDIDVVFRVGKKHLKCAKERVIILKLTNEKTKNEILRNKMKLRGSSVFIDNDYPKEALQKMNEIRKKRNKNQKSVQKIYEKSAPKLPKYKTPPNKSNIKLNENENITNFPQISTPLSSASQITQ